MRLPRKLISQTHEAQTVNEIIDYLRSLTPARTDGNLLKHTPHGMFYEAPKQTTQRGTNNGSGGTVWL